ncbi:MAG TPA: hypothetical protein VHB73_02650, partial [Alphaproteobacteria bacterium]|nr:hypothetical protein [Alphaproteobacteria bacterium]
TRSDHSSYEQHNVTWNYVDPSGKATPGFTLGIQPEQFGEGRSDFRFHFSGTKESRNTEGCMTAAAHALKDGFLGGLAHALGMAPSADYRELVSQVYTNRARLPEKISPSIEVINPLLLAPKAPLQQKITAAWAEDERKAAARARLAEHLATRQERYKNAAPPPQPEPPSSLGGSILTAFKRAMEITGEVEITNAQVMGAWFTPVAEAPVPPPAPAEPATRQVAPAEPQKSKLVFTRPPKKHG